MSWLRGVKKIEEKKMPETIPTEHTTPVPIKTEEVMPEKILEQEEETMQNTQLPQKLFQLKQQEPEYKIVLPLQLELQQMLQFVEAIGIMMHQQNQELNKRLDKLNEINENLESMTRLLKKAITDAELS
jgi:hypothetical protein